MAFMGPAPTGYTVRLSEVMPAADALKGLWQRNLHIPPAVDLDARLRWYYLEAPEGAGRVALLVDGAQEVVGCEAIGVRRFALAGRPEPVRVGLLGDLAVDRRHRTLMPALTLVRAGRTAANQFAFHYGFPNANAAPLYQRLGYRKLGTVTRWVRVLRRGRYVGRVIKNPVVAGLGGALLDGALQLEALLMRALPGPPLELDPLADTDGRLDQLWEIAHRQWGAIGWRGAAQVRWRFLRAPGTRCELMALVEPHTRALRAYAVLEPADSTYHVRDFFGAGLRDVGRLFDLLVAYVHRRGASALSVSFLGAPRVEALLREHRFHPRESTRTVIVDAAPEISVPPADEWYLTDADEDT
jgi:hypothetical protein